MLREALRPTFAWLAMLCACSLFLSGCGSSGREMANVSGKVTLNGQPAIAGRIIFANVEGPSAVAQIQPDGTYSVEAAIGQTMVTIDHREKPKPVASGPEPMMRARMEGLTQGNSLVPERYTDARTSGLSLDVKTGVNEFDIEMKD
ncbi:MAG: hypothetical protein JXM70_05150 [Pirellulales bacterium]|nr:hypothetical protein [Pirellulales bacterium]